MNDKYFLNDGAFSDDIISDYTTLVLCILAASMKILFRNLTLIKIDNTLGKQGWWQQDGKIFYRYPKVGIDDH